MGPFEEPRIRAPKERSMKELVTIVAEVQQTLQEATDLRDRIQADQSVDPKFTEHNISDLKKIIKDCTKCTEILFQQAKYRAVQTFGKEPKDLDEFKKSARYTFQVDDLTDKWAKLKKTYHIRVPD